MCEILYPLNLSFHYNNTINDVGTHFNYNHMRFTEFINDNCCSFLPLSKSAIRSAINGSDERFYKWPLIYLCSFFQALFDLIITSIVTALSVLILLICFVAMVLFGLTTPFKFNCEICKCVFSGVSLTNRQIFLASLYVTLATLTSYIYFPVYVLLNILQIFLPHFTLCVLKYDLFFTKTREESNA